MALGNVPTDRSDEAADKVEKFLSRSIPIRSVEPVEADLVESRTPSRGFKEQLPEYSIYLRVETEPLKKFDLLETRSGLFEHIRDSLETMEMNAYGPDSIVVGEDHPPEHLNKPLVYFVESTI